MKIKFAYDEDDLQRLIESAHYENVTVLEIKPILKKRKSVNYDGESYFEYHYWYMVIGNV